MIYRVMLTRDYKYCKGIVWAYETRYKALAVLVHRWYAFVRLMSAMPKTNLTWEEIETGKVLPFRRQR